MLRILVQQQAFDIGAETARLTEGRLGAGAVASFVGLVRDNNRVAGSRDPVDSLTLEHYPGMTEKALRQIAERAAERWSLQAATVIHRVGELHPGDAIVLVLTAAAHRQDAFDACQYIMDLLKTEAPFWKKERLPDGGERWVDSRSSDAKAAERWEDDGF
jgi:molybdopterin synthase catalytic subunit